MRNNNKKKLSLLDRVLFITGILLIAFGVYNLAVLFLNYKEAQDEYKSLETENIVVKDNDTGEWWYSCVNIDFDALSKINPDIIGWIRFDSLSISYPIMHSDDNLFYLKHTFNKINNDSGSIFMEAGNSSDFLDSHTIIYGHNMRDGSMFGRLKNYKAEDFYNENKYFTIYTPQNTYRYEIFSCKDVSEDSSIYTVGFKANKEFKEFIDQMARSSYYDTGVGLYKKDKVVTLSTCSAVDERFVVHAKRVGEHTQKVIKKSK